MLWMIPCGIRSGPGESDVDVLIAWVSFALVNGLLWLLFPSVVGWVVF